MLIWPYSAHRGCEAAPRAASMPRFGVFGMSAAGRSRHKPEKGGFSF
jgi:hypothetical protein